MNEEIELVTFNKVIQSEHYTVFLLGTQEKHFPIYTEPKVGQNLEAFLSNQKSPRPQTYDLMSSIFRSFDIKPLQVLFHDVQDNVYFCRLFLEQVKGEVREILEIDTRPSDALTIALMYDVPIFCTKELLSKAPHVDF